jgi:cysteine desulfurase
MSPLRIYLDHNATTPLLPSVWTELQAHYGELMGNASSIHWAGRKAKEWLRRSRQAVAGALSASPLEIVWTSGASEANSLLLQNLVRHLSSRSGRYRVISSSIEHPSVSETLAHLAQKDLIEWVQIPVSREGEWDWDRYRAALGPQVLLVSVMAANNETGLVLPLNDIAVMAKQAGALVHSDITQAFLKLPLSLEAIDYATFSGHKVHAMKGVGVLYIRRGSPFYPAIFGGPQERFRRAGTENVWAIASLGLAVEKLSTDLAAWRSHLAELRHDFESRLLQELPEVIVTHSASPRLPNTSHIRISGVDGESLLMKMDIDGVALSAGSACSSGRYEPSPGLLSMGFHPQEIEAALRVSFGYTNTREEVMRALEILKKNVLHLRGCRKSAPRDLGNTRGERAESLTPEPASSVMNK